MKNMEDPIAKLSDAIDRFYKIDQNGKNDYMEIKQIIENKLSKIDFETEWVKVVREFERSYEVMDLAFLQFPSYKLYLEEIEQVGPDQLVKNFTICVSLLCPFYTFFFEYELRPPNEEFDRYSGKTAFLNEVKFNLLKREVDVIKVQSILTTHFQGFKYVDHYLLMKTKVSAGIPYGEFYEQEYSMYAYLFDAAEIKNVFQ